MALSVTSAVFVPFNMRDKNGSHINNPDRTSSFIVSEAGIVALPSCNNRLMQTLLVSALATARVTLTLALRSSPDAVEAHADDFLRPMNRYADEWGTAERPEPNKLVQYMCTEHDM
jgi:hypothetical protein